MTGTHEDREAQIAAFDQEADRPREGWTVATGSVPELMELWTRQAGESMLLGVLGLAAEADSAAGYWLFTVEVEGKPVCRGESSRRGWAMDGAEEVMRRRLN